MSVYCGDHDEVLCNTCNTVKHERCNTYDLKDKSEAFGATKLSLTLEKTYNLQVEAQAFQKDRNSDLQTLDILKDSCLQKIKSFWKEFDTFFDTLENNTTSELEKCATEKRQIIQRLMSKCATMNRLLESGSNLVEAAKTSGEKDTMFASNVNLSNRFKECSAMLREL